MFNDEQISEIKQIYNNWQTGVNYSDVPELCKSATVEDIRAQDYSLAPSKYIEFIDDVKANAIGYEKLAAARIRRG